MKAVGIIGLIVVVAIFGPVLIIWSLNTLFALGIPFTIDTWFAAFILAGTVGSSISKT